MKAAYLILTASIGTIVVLAHMYSCSKSNSTNAPKKFEVQAIPDIFLNSSAIVYGGAFAFSPFFPVLSTGLADTELFILISGLVVAIVSILNLRKYW
jgi:hypothetical protein